MYFYALKFSLTEYLVQTVVDAYSEIINDDHPVFVQRRECIRYVYLCISRRTIVQYIIDTTFAPG